MYVCIYLCFVCMYVPTISPAPTRSSCTVCMYVCMYICIYVETDHVLYVCIHVTVICIYVSMYNQTMYVCMYVCMHVCEYQRSRVASAQKKEEKIRRPLTGSDRVRLTMKQQSTSNRLGRSTLSYYHIHLPILSTKHFAQGNQ